VNRNEEIYLCQPTYGDICKESSRQFWVRALEPKGPHSGLRIIQDTTGHSLLANCFNYHWANALNLQLAGRNITRFVMLHSDIIPEDWWADKLLLELEETDADLLSVVVPIKDSRGLTSVAIDDPIDEWGVYRRLTMSEVIELPETFGIYDCVKNGLTDGHVWKPSDRLLVNSGCWACRFDREWNNDENSDGSLKSYFTIKDKIQFNSTTGRYETVVMPEDWHFSRCLNKLGRDIKVTRKVRLGHRGALYYPNDSVWGDYKQDEDLRHKWDRSIVTDKETREIERESICGR
jgi:hypothetical protein